MLVYNKLAYRPIFVIIDMIVCYLDVSNDKRSTSSQKFKEAKSAKKNCYRENKGKFEFSLTYVQCTVYNTPCHPYGF